MLLGRDIVHEHQCNKKYIFSLHFFPDKTACCMAFGDRDNHSESVDRCRATVTENRLHAGVCFIYIREIDGGSRS